MNKLSFLFLLFLSSSMLAQDKIQFEEGSWKSILRQAKAQNSLIFLDAYTSWCGPCKMMDKDVFTDKEVAAYYNSNFVNAHFDMEKGEGPALASKYNVRAYPTLLFIDSDGTVVHETLGYHAPKDLLEEGRTALDPNKRSSGMKSRYDAGERDPEFLYQYAKRLIEMDSGNHEEVVDAYFDTQFDWGTEKNMALLFYGLNNSTSKSFDYFIKNRKSFEALFGKDKVVDRVQNIVLRESFDTSGDADFNKVASLFKKIYPEESDRMTANYKMNYYRAVGEGDNFAKAAISYYKKYPSINAMELNNVSWAFYQSVDKKKYLCQATKWTKKSLEIDPQYYTADTLAALYVKMKKKGKAKKAVANAIALAKKSGDDYSGTEALLEQL